MNEQPMQNNITCCEKEDFLTKDTVTCIAKKTQLYSFFWQDDQKPNERI